MRRERIPCRKHFTEPGLTQQHFKDECDVNFVLEQYIRTGEISSRGHSGIYGDFTNAADYFTSALRIGEAQASFDALPARVRARMDNDPHQLLLFLADPANTDEARDLGLLEPEENLPEDAPKKTAPPPETGENPPAES